VPPSTRRCLSGNGPLTRSVASTVMAVVAAAAAVTIVALGALRRVTVPLHRPPVRTWATLPGHPSTRPWGEPCIGRPSTTVYGWSSVLAGATCLSCRTSVRFSDVAGGTPVHSSSAPTSATITLDIGSGSGIRSPSPTASARWRSRPHTRDRLGGRLQRHQPHHTLPCSHLLLSHLCLPTLPPSMLVMVLFCPLP
jgi:hypothetical protein